MLVAFVAAPLTQTIYGLIVMNRMVELTAQGHDLWGIGAFCGVAIGLSAYFQGKCAACACDAMDETGKGFGNFMIILGMTETVALLVMAFTLGILGRFAVGINSQSLAKPSRDNHEEFSFFLTTSEK